MEAGTNNDPSTGLKINNALQNKFFQNPKFRRHIEQQMQNKLSIEISINSQQSGLNKPNNYTISVMNKYENKADSEQTIRSFIKKLFKTMQSKIFDDLTGN